MVKAIIFDAGGVYLKGSFNTFVDKSCSILGIGNRFRTATEIVFDSDFNRGKISAQECFKKYFGVPITDAQMNQIITVWLNTWVPTKEMTDFVHKLKGKYTLAMLSNSDKINSVAYTQKGWYSVFDVVVLSHEEGILKPEERIYEIALERLNLVAEECIFIDDQKDVLIPAKSMGMKTIQFRSVEQLQKDLQKLGVYVE
jgi:epoxide hydrolase-like predicted phosphatase